VNKTPSTPVSPERGVLGGLEEAREQGGWAFESVSSLGHGTTVGTDAVLEGT
jgi:N-methylhydantoinase A